LITYANWTPALSVGLLVAMNEVAEELGSDQLSLEEFKENLLHPEWSPATQLFVALNGREVVGYCDGWLGMYSELRATLSLGVRQRWRSQGIGTALLSRSCNHFFGRCDVIQVRTGELATVHEEFLKRRSFADQSISVLLRRDVEKLLCPAPQGTDIVPWSAFSDENVFRALHNDVFLDVPHWRPITAAAMRQYVGSSLFQQGELHFVMRGARPIAWIWMSVDEDQDLAYVESLGVIPSERQRRVGSFLLRFAQQLAAARDCTHLELSVEAGNERALGVYLRAGFEVKQKYLWLQSTPGAVLQAIAKGRR
jgi:ribosomal protein S18 acetylase RimI-like enzyme